MGSHLLSGLGFRLSSASVEDREGLGKGILAGFARFFIARKHASRLLLRWERELAKTSGMVYSHSALGFAERGDWSVWGSRATRSRLILKPGQRGTKKLCAEYGERLVCVRYRYDEEWRKRIKTVELVVDEVDWEPRAPKMGGDTIVGLRVGWKELDLRERVKTAGGRWDPASRLWELRYDRVVALGLEERITRDVGE